MQAALMIRSKKRVARRKRLRKEGRLYDLPSNVSVKQLQPFPQYPPDQWVGDLDTSVKCAQGRAAWLERGRRCSITDNAASCHRRWVKRNRIHDSSLGGSSDDEDFLGALRGPSSFANAFLYVGLGTVALGLVILFVGTGEKGFKTLELRMIGPSLIGIGLVCCMLRIFFCICPSHCISSSREKLKKKNAKVDADHTTSLLRADTKRVSIARPEKTKYPPEAQNFLKKHPHSKMNEGMEALRQIASTSLFLQNEKNNSGNAVPTIQEQHEITDPASDAQNELNNSIDVFDLSDTEDNDVLVKLGHELPSTSQSKSIQKSTEHPTSTGVSFLMKPIQPERQPQPRASKLSRTRAPVNQQKQKEPENTTETSLMTLDATTSFSTNASSITLAPSIPSSSYTQFNSNDGHPFKQTAIATNSQSIPMKPIIQDGSTKLTFVQPATATNVTSANSSNSTSSFEPELVLSPAKLGQ